jgi:hypothetical protein
VVVWPIRWGNTVRVRRKQGSKLSYRFSRNEGVLCYRGWEVTRIEYKYLGDVRPPDDVKSVSRHNR